MAKREQAELSEAARERITRVVRSLAEDRVERGVELNRPMHCDSCAQERGPAGAAVYGPYRLCNDCLLDFTLALASGRIDNVHDFMTRKTEGPDSEPPSELAPQRDRSVSLNPLPGRVMPSNEPC